MDEVDRLIAAGKNENAVAMLGEVWRRDRSPALAGFVVSRFEALRVNLSLDTRRAAILRSFTVEPVIPLLRAGAFLAGIDLTVRVGDFNAYAQEVLDPASWLYGFAPDIVILAVQARDLAPDLWQDFVDLSTEHVTAAVARVTGTIRSLVAAFRARSKAYVMLHSLELPSAPANGILDAQSDTSQSEAFRRINSDLSKLTREQPGVFLVDYDSLVARQGRTAWHDERKWLTMRMPIEANHLVCLADEWLRFIHPLAGKICKVLVTDLDNTLWGGVIGEDGMTGIKLGPEYPGAAYLALQRAMLDLRGRGVILAVLSKNNPADAIQVLDQHPAMLLHTQHFAALRINWNDKAPGLREIATELNVGIDALAFLDDSPAEREWIRSQVPEVTVIDLPQDPMDYASCLRASPVFERLSVSAEDHERGRYYAEQRLRTELEQSVTTKEDFLRSLQMEVRMGLANSGTLARVAQLTQKTNQFNLTTRRYSEQQIAQIASNPNWRVYTAQVVDRFGDSGLVGVAITRRSGGNLEIDTFLLSCRVIGRAVETAMLAVIAEQARSEGVTKLVGWYLPTKKNAPAREFFGVHGFLRTLEQEENSRWELDLAVKGIRSPSWIKLAAFTEGPDQ
jgi:FkbH-like protein